MRGNVGRIALSSSVLLSETVKLNLCRRYRKENPCALYDFVSNIFCNCYPYFFHVIFKLTPQYIIFIDLVICIGKLRSNAVHCLSPLRCFSGSAEKSRCIFFLKPNICRFLFSFDLSPL